MTSDQQDRLYQACGAAVVWLAGLAFYRWMGWRDLWVLLLWSVVWVGIIARLAKVGSST